MARLKTEMQLDTLQRLAEAAAISASGIGPGTSEPEQPSLFG
jgi:hypothetical protein